MQCGEHTQTQKPTDELAYTRWAEVESAGVAAHTVPLEDDRVLMLHPTEPPAFHTPLTITCGAKQVQTCLEPTTFDPQGRTLISIHLLLAAEQVRRPTLTLAKLWVELSILYTPSEGVVRPGRVGNPDDVFPKARLRDNGWRRCVVRGLRSGGCIPTWYMSWSSRAEVLQH